MKEGHGRQLHCILGNIFKTEEGSEGYVCQLQRMETHQGDKVLSAQDRSRMSHHCKRPRWLSNLSGPGKLKDAIVKGLAKSWPLEHLKTLGKKLCNRTQQYSVEENKTVSTEEDRHCSNGQV